MPTASISIVIVNFNGGQWLERCVASVLASSVAVEIHIGDNASIDGSPEAVKQRFASCGNVHLTENGANLGFSRAVNRLLANVAPQTEWVVLLNPDCELAPDTLEKVRNALENDPQAGMAGGLIANPDGSEQRGCRRRIPTLKSAAMQSIGLSAGDFDLAGTPLPVEATPVEAISGAFMFIRRQALAVVGGLDEGYFMHCEDLDWCLRFTRAGYRILFVPDARIVHAKGACSQTNRLSVEWWKHKGMLRFWRKFYGQGWRIVWVAALAPAVLARFALSATRILFRQEKN